MLALSVDRKHSEHLQCALCDQVILQKTPTVAPRTIHAVLSDVNSALEMFVEVSEHCTVKLSFQQELYSFVSYKNGFIKALSLCLIININYGIIIFSSFTFNGWAVEWAQG